MTMPDLNGSRILVLGASGELGRRLAKLLARHGATLALAGRRGERLLEVADDIEGDPKTIVADLRKPEDNRRVVAEAVEAMGGLDGVVNAAGVVAFGPLAEMGPETVDELFRVNLLGPLEVIQESVPHLQDGFVVNLTGVVAESPVANMTAYSAAKAGLSAAATALTRELRRSGVLFVDARPPHVETGLADRPISGEAPRMPDGLDPDAVAAAIVEGIETGQRELPAASFVA
jgi:cyclic-di-GMP-binding biofilm dispersal mediator protein